MSSTPSWTKLLCLFQDFLFPLAEKQKIRDLIVTMPISPTNLDTSSVSWKLKTLFDSCMDVEYIEGEGHKPLTKLLTDIGMYSMYSNVHTYGYYKSCYMLTRNER